MKNRRFHVGLVLCMALCLLLFAPASADYSRALLDRFCQAWTDDCKAQNVPIRLDNSGVSDPWITVMNEGGYALRKSGERHTIVEALTSDETLVTVTTKAAVLIDLFELSIFDDGLDETPQRMKILIEGSELASADAEIFRDSVNTLYNFKFGLKDFYAFAGLMRRGAQIRFEFTTDRGTSGVTISGENTPTLCRSIQLLEDGMYFCGYMGSQKGDESLLPVGGQEKPEIAPKPTAEPSPKPTAGPAANSGVPSELQGKTFSKGDKGALVTRIKMRMQQTGYYLLSATMNDEFNESMVRRVKQLQEKNGLPVTGVMDAQTLERLFSDQVVRGELDAPSAPSVTAQPTAKPTAKPTPKPEATSSVPFALRGKTYSKGDKGAVVTRIKTRMQQMGYYRRTATFDDEYNDTMVQRVKQIQERNRLSVTGIMDPQTMEKLYDDKLVRGEFYAPSTPKPTPRPTPKPTPKPTRKPTPTPKPTRTPEPRVTLVLPKGGRGEWKSESGDKMLFRVKVKNESGKRTVTAFKLYFYTEDIWGERDPEEGTVYTVTTKKNVKPGKTAFSDYVVLPHRSQIYRVHAAISDVRYSDGTIEEVYFPDYFCWEIK